jgi:UDP-GlcNAc:undecaprenyl-phosphate GlcNAc-1-phosphate transferase
LSISFADESLTSQLPIDLRLVVVVFVLLIPQAVALATSWMLTALLILLAPHVGLIDQPSDRKIHAEPTPRGGGLAIFAAVALAFGAAGLVRDVGSELAFFRIALGCSSIIVILGLLDDSYSLSWQSRLLIQTVVATLAVYLSLVNNGWLPIAAATLWVVAMTNAFNMLDNMDALSAGVGLIASGFLAAAFLLTVPADELAGIMMPYLILVAALAGFLWFNRPPARIFMGDSGSTFLGFFVGLGTAELASPVGGPRLGVKDWSVTRWLPIQPAWSWAAALAICAVPCYDMASVIFLRLKQGRSPFHADKQHLSHRLVERGLSKPAAVGVIYLLALASGATGLVLLLVSTPMAAALAGGQLVVWWVAFAVIEWRSVRVQDPAGTSPRQAGGYINPMPTSPVPPKESSHEPPT